MRRLILIAALLAVIFAKPQPETYKETEDFQYSRSSSDDGTKSGFYGAQRGNMGGNYERAHNMDTLAQHQMSGLVRQVDGELGEGVKTRTGSVYTAANSRGIYGSGNYDLRNLQGRNFAEGESIGNSQSHSLSSLSSQNSRYRGQSYSGMETNAGSSSSHLQDTGYRGYQTSRHSNQRQIDNLQAVDTSQGLGTYESDNQAAYNTNYQTIYGSHGRREFDQSAANFQSSTGHDANSQARYITTPVRVVVRPGGRVAIPIAAPTYSVSQTALSDVSAINSDAEVINQPTPTNKVKHYEASYSYRKQWEKHHAIPGDVSLVVPTENPFPKNSELYEDAQLLQSAKNELQNANSQTLHTGTMNSNQRAFGKSASSHSRFQAGYNAQHSQSGFESQQKQAGFNAQTGQSDLSSLHGQSGLNSLQTQSGLNTQQSQLGFNEQQTHFGVNSQQSRATSATRSNAYGHNALNSGAAADLINAVGDVNSKPKSYHSSYSYHKSWERQGDPYIIKPVSPIYDAQASERLTAASSNSAAYTSRQYGSHSKQAHHSYSSDCDDEAHIRVARSYNTDQQLEQVQNQWEDLGQQVEGKLENLEDLGQQTQNNWDQLQQVGQESHNQWDNLQQLGQETQNHWDNLQQLGQQTQNQWDNLQQLGQETQNKWDNLEDLGQQTDRNQEQHRKENREDITTFEHQANNQNEMLNDFNKPNQKYNHLTNFEQHENLEDFSQHTQKEEGLTNFEQHENLEDFSQHNQKEHDLTNFEQQSSNQNEDLDVFNQHTQNVESLLNFEQKENNHKEHELTNFEQQSSNQNENLDVFNQHTQNVESLTNFEQQSSNQNENLDVFNQHTQNVELLTNFEQKENNHKEQELTNFDQQSSNQNENLDVFNQHTQNVESLTNFEQKENNHKEQELTNFEQQSSNQNENLDAFSQHNQNVEFPSFTNWDQTIVLQPQSNVPSNVDKHFFPESKSNKNYQDLFKQNQENTWYQSNANEDKNINAYDIMRPISQWSDKSDMNSPLHNVFPLSPINTEYHELGHHYKEQNSLQNINNKYEHNFWHMDHVSNYNNQFDNNFSQSSFSTSDTGSDLQGLWNVIDNIAGEVTATESNTDSKSLLSPDYPKLNLQNANDNQMGGDLNKLPINTSVNLVNTNIDTEANEEQLVHHNLFEEQIDRKHISTTVLPILSSTYAPVMQEITTSTNSHNQQPVDRNHNKHLQDEGRGDIEPEEIEVEEKPYKTIGNIEILSLAKETPTQKVDEAVIQTNPKINEVGKTGNNLFVTNFIEQENTNENKFKVHSTWQSGVTTTMSSVQMSTYIKDHDVYQPLNEPSIDLLNLKNNPLPELQKQLPHQLALENVEIPENIEQQNTDQQVQDLSQINNMEQVYDQQNVEQQFEDFHQHESMQFQNNLQDFGQHIQSPLTSLKEVQIKDEEKDIPNQFYVPVMPNPSHTHTSYPTPNQRDTTENLPRVVEPIQVTHYVDTESKNQNLVDNQNIENSKSQDVQIPVEVSTEKSGFWKSVGNKLTSAKNKVASWFSRS